MIPETDRVTLRAAWTAVVILAAANTFSFIDRLLPAILLDPIKSDLGLSDTQMGLIHGLPFAVFYAALGLFFGRWADRGDRPKLIAIGVALWSVATVACALTIDFWSLFAARVFVAVGEAALAPAAYSLIAALFVSQVLGRALSVYQIGIYLGSGLALILGGLIAGGAVAGADSWRLAFVVAGLPGLLLALLTLTLPEPRRHGARASSATVTIAVQPVRDWRPYLLHFFAFSLIGVAAYGVSSWLPSVLVRLHGFKLVDAGLALGVILVLASPLGVTAAGWLADRGYRRGDKGAAFVVGGFGALALAPAAALYGLAPTGMVAVLAAIPLAFLSSFPFGVAALSLQLMTPSASRGQVTAVYLLVFTVIGYGIGPVAIGLANDSLFGGPAGVGRSIALVVGLSAPLAALLLFVGARAFGRRVEALRTANALSEQSA